MLRKRSFRWAVILAAVLLVSSEGFSLLLRTAASRRYLTARLESSFGRPVDVRAFSFSLLDGPRIEASDVSVAEDPRFGNEYFIRADQLTAGPRWSALLSGHFEFGTLSFTSPTLNLVRLADGHWNLESWLPAPAAAGNRAAGGGARAAVLRFHLARIEVVSGRVNFKEDQDVRPFALEDVSGDLEQESAGRWQLDFNAQPMRPGVAQPQSGMVRIHGIVGGTSSRLQPADLDVTLWGASIEDALRLARGQDYGMRGALEADLHAHAEPPAPDAAANPSAAAPADWNVTGAVRLSGIHRWESPANPGQPSVNVIFDAMWRSGESRVSIASCDVEAPGSAVHASGELAWNHGFHPRIALAPSEIAYEDLLAWYRTLRGGVDDDLSVEGSFRAEGAAQDWPPRIVDASLESAGARVVPNATLAPLRLGRWNTSLQAGGLNSSLAVVQFEPLPGAPAASRPSPLRIQASLLMPQSGHGAADHGWRFRVAADGTADRVQDYLALARQCGWPAAPLWSAEGSLAFHVNGEGDFHRGSTDWKGTIESRDLLLQFAFLNQPVELSDVSLALGSGAAQKLTLASAQAFDAHWSGTIFRSAAHPAWQFDLTADRLDAAALDRWIEPRARPAGLLDRLGIFGAPQGAGGGASEQAPAIPILARGRLRVGEFDLAPLRVVQLDAYVEVAGKTIQVHRAKGGFAGGAIEGELTAALGAEPTYDAQMRFDRVDLATLAQDVPSLAGKFDGAASCDLSLRAGGIGRDALLDSLTGHGSLSARNLQIRGFHLGSLREDPSAAGDERFGEGRAEFRVENRNIRAAPVKLTRPAGDSLVANGSVDFQGALDFRIEVPTPPRFAPTRVAGPAMLSDSAAPASAAFHLTGSVAAPLLVPSTAGDAPPSLAPHVRGAGREAQR
jgi:hypothetical protein